MALQTPHAAWLPRTLCHVSYGRPLRCRRITDGRGDPASGCAADRSEATADCFSSGTRAPHTAGCSGRGYLGGTGLPRRVRKLRSPSARL